MKPITIGLVGIGRAGWGMHLGEIAKTNGKFEIKAACDPLEERRKMMEERFAGCHTYSNIDDMLKDDSYELAVIACRSPEHTSYALKALAAGKIVFLEKPLGSHPEDAAKLRAAAKEYPGKLYCRHNRRFEPAFNHVKEIIQSDILGEVYEIKLCRHSYQRRDDWQTIVAEGGGQLNNWGPHIIDHALRLLESPVKDIWADLKNVAALGDAEDHLKIVLRGQNGRVVDLEISGGITLPSPVYAVYGTKGSLISPDEQDIILKYLDPKQVLADSAANPATPPISGPFGNSEVLKWVRKTIMVEPANGCNGEDIYPCLYAAIREGKPFPITVEEACQVLDVTFAVKKMCEVKQY